MSNDGSPPKAAHTESRDMIWRWLGLFLAVLITFILVRIAVLNIFYTTGDMHDPGWFASVTWHNGWHLRGPPAFWWSYFEEHVSPILWLTNGVSYIVPLAKFDYYAAFIASIYALYAAGIYRAWQLTNARITPSRTIVAILVALAATFSGVGVTALGLPHWELAIPALALWFFMAMARHAYRSAAVWLAACLLFREDAGLHVAALLVPWAGMLALRQRAVTKDVRWLLAFAGIAFGYSVMAFLAKHIAFPHGDNFTSAYPGSPPWHHVTLPFVIDRLYAYLLLRSYVLLPMLLAFAWAAISRNPLIPLGYIAALPWLALSFFALHDTPGTLGYYYGFPFWLSLAWPLLAVRLWQRTDSQPNRRWPYALLLLTSVSGWQWDRWVAYPLAKDIHDDYPFVYHDTLRNRSQYQAFIDYFLANRPLFGATALDEAVFGLLNDHADEKDWLELWPSNSPPETIIYYHGAYDWRPRVLPLLRSGTYRCIYAVPGTRIGMATKNPLGERLPTPGPFVPIGMMHDPTGVAAAEC